MTQNNPKAGSLDALKAAELEARHERYRVWQEIEELESRWKKAKEAGNARAILDCEAAQPALRLRALELCEAQESAYAKRWPVHEPELMRPQEKANADLAERQMEHAHLIKRHPQHLKEPLPPL